MDFSAIKSPAKNASFSSSPDQTADFQVTIKVPALGILMCLGCFFWSMTEQTYAQVLSDAELMAEVGRINGAYLQNEQQLRSVIPSFRSGMAIGMSSKMTPSQAVAFHAALASALDSTLATKTRLPRGTYYMASATISVVLSHYAIAAFQEHQDAGSKRRLTEIADRLVADTVTILIETPELLEALTSAAQSTGAPQRAILDSVFVFQNAGSITKREEARLLMARVTEAQRGVRSGWLTNTVGQNGMLQYLNNHNPEILHQGIETIMRANQSMMIGDFDLIINGMVRDSPLRMALGNRTAEFAHSVFQTIPRLKLNEIQNIIVKQGLDAAREKLASYDLPSFGNASLAFHSANQHLRQVSDRRIGIEDFLWYIGNAVDQLSSLSAMVTTEGLSIQSGKEESSVSR